MYTFQELKDAATAKVEAEEKLTEIGQGVGGLGIHHPEMLKDWSRWVDMSEDGHHADTVLSLLEEIDRQRKMNRFLNACLDALEDEELEDD